MKSLQISLKPARKMSIRHIMENRKKRSKKRRKSRLKKWKKSRKIKVLRALLRRRNRNRKRRKKMLKLWRLWTQKKAERKRVERVLNRIISTEYKLNPNTRKMEPVTRKTD